MMAKGLSTRQSVGGKIKIKKYKNGKSYICVGCREQYGISSVMGKDEPSICPRCGRDIISKVEDEKVTHGSVMRPHGNATGGRKSHIKKVR